MSKSIPELYIKLFEDLSFIKNIHYLVYMDSKNDWFLKNIEMKIGEFLKNQKIIKVYDKSKNNFNNLMCFDSDNLNQLMGRFFRSEILTQNKEISNLWRKIFKLDWFKFNFSSLNFAMKLIEINFKNLERLNNYFNSEIETFEFLNKIYNLNIGVDFLKKKFFQIKME